MKKRLLLLIIYLAFIGLGLPDSLLGAGWPSMYEDLKVPVHYAGIIFMIIAGGTVISSLYSARLIYRYGVAVITTISVLMTAVSLLGFSYSGHFILLCLLAVPLGLSAGAVDVGLNNYVALYYEAKHMNWLHSFWGIGATIGPMMMAYYLAQGSSWTMGYFTVGWMQVGLFFILIISFPLWMKIPNNQKPGGKSKTYASFRKLLHIPGLRQTLLIFFCYCTIEATFGLWGASYLVIVRDFSAEDSARLVSFYFGGIAGGRIISGFLSSYLNNRQLVNLGQGIIGLGLIVLLFPSEATILPGFLLIGLGCAPIFPSLLHETPRNFGEEHSQSIMGMQMASAYVGITLMPLFFGELAYFAGYQSLLWFLALFLAAMIWLTYHLNLKIP